MSRKFYAIIFIFLFLLLAAAGCGSKNGDDNNQPAQQLAGEDLPSTDPLPEDEDSDSPPATGSAEQNGPQDVDGAAYQRSGRALLEYFSQSLIEKQYDAAASLFTQEMTDEIALYDYQSPVVYLQEVFSVPGNIRLEITEETPEIVYALIHRAQGSTGFVAYRANGSWKLGFDSLLPDGFEDEFDWGTEEQSLAYFLAILEPLAGGQLTRDVEYFTAGLRDYTQLGKEEGLSQAQSLLNNMYDYFLPVFYAELTNGPGETWAALQDQIGAINVSMQDCLAYAEGTDKNALLTEINRVTAVAKAIEQSAAELKTILIAM